MVDDYLPYAVTDEHGHILLNTQMNNETASPSFWVALAEKGFAKAFVNYANLDGGDQMESLRALTGMPVHTYYNTEYTDIGMFALIEEGEENDWVMTASCLKSNQGLAPLHVYTVLGTVTLNRTEPFDRPEKLIKLRNTWGSENFTGPWSDEAKEWNEELMA